MAATTDYQALVRAIQSKTGENQSQLGERIGVSQPTISRWLRGTPPELHHTGLIEQAAKDLRIINRKFAANVTAVPIVGYVGAGGSIDFSESQGPFGEAEMPPKGASKSLVAVIVKGDSMSGLLEDGWTVYYDDRRDPPDETLHGKLCIVGVLEGPVLIKKLVPGRLQGHYHLVSTNAPLLQDQPIEWAAKIVWIAPA